MLLELPIDTLPRYRGSVAKRVWYPLHRPPMCFGAEFLSTRIRAGNRARGAVQSPARFRRCPGQPERTEAELTVRWSFSWTPGPALRSTEASVARVLRAAKQAGVAAARPARASRRRTGKLGAMEEARDSIATGL